MSAYLLVVMFSVHLTECHTEMWMEILIYSLSQYCPGQTTSWWYKFSKCFFDHCIPSYLLPLKMSFACPNLALPQGLPQMLFHRETISPNNKGVISSPSDSH